MQTEEQKLEIAQGLLEIENSAWWKGHEAHDPLVADLLELENMLKSAPDQLARGFMFGLFAMRQNLSQITGRPF